MTPVFIRVPKTGSTSVSRLIFGDVDQAHCRASELPSGPNCYRFGFVRDPYTRALSAFNWYRHRTSARWTQPFRDLPFAEWIVSHLRGIDPTVDGFESQSKYFDAPVEFIGRFETLEVDVQLVLGAIGRPPAALPRLNTTVPNDPAEYTAEARRVVREVYVADFERFGYG